MRFLYPFILWFLATIPCFANMDVDKGIVLNFSTGSPNPILSTVSGVPVSAGIEFGGHTLTGNTSGRGFVWYNADDWGGSPIIWNYVSPLFPANNPSQAASLKKFTVLTDGPYQQFSMRAYTIGTFVNGMSQWQARDGSKVTTTPNTVTDITTWNYGATASNIPQLIDFSSRGNGRYWFLRLYSQNGGDHIDLQGVQAILTIGGLRN